MSKNVMAESAALLGEDTPVSPVDYQPRETQAASKLLMDYEDSEKESVVQSTVPQMVIPSRASNAGDPDYDNLDSLMGKGVTLYSVWNTAKSPIVLDWDLVLLPEDMQETFKKYLSEKYIAYNMQHMIGKAMMVAIYVDGRTINFLQNFMTEKQIPTLVSVQEGKESFIRSKFVIHPDEKIIVTAKQLESLGRYEKVRYVASKSEEKTKESSVLGFLVFNPIEKASELRDYQRSYVTYQDVLRSDAPVAPETLIQKTSRRMGNFVRLDK